MNRPAALTEKRASLAKEIARAERAIERYQDAFENGDLDPARFKQRLSTLDARLDALHGQDRALALELAADAPTTPDTATLHAIADRLDHVVAHGEPDVQAAFSDPALRQRPSARVPNMRKALIAVPAVLLAGCGSPGTTSGTSGTTTATSTGTTASNAVQSKTTTETARTPKPCSVVSEAEVRQLLPDAGAPSGTSIACTYSEETRPGSESPKGSLTIEVLPVKLGGKDVCAKTIEQIKHESTSHVVSSRKPIQGLGAESYAQSSEQSLDGRSIATNSATWAQSGNCINIILGAEQPAPSQDDFLAVVRAAAAGL